VYKPIRVLLTIAVVAVAGCGGMGTTKFFHPEFDFGYTERVAVIPFENLSNDQGAGARASRMFVAELLSTEAFDVVEPGEVAKALGQINLVRTADLDQEQARTLGRNLGVQALFLGSVGESGTMRSGGGQVNVVTMTVRMVETDSGVTVWSATSTADSKSFWSALFGTGGQSPGEVMRSCVHTCVESLF